MNERDRNAVRVVVHPYATAMPLGCFAFGIGNTIVAAFLAHWIPVSDTQTVAFITLAFVAPLELIASIMAFLSRDSGAATAMGIFAGGWIIYGMQLLAFGAGASSPATGIFLILLALCLAILAVASFTGKPLIASLFCVAMLRSTTAGLLEFRSSGPLTIATVWLGLLVAALAFYCGFGLLLEDVMQRPLQMMYRTGKAKKAMVASLSEQLENVAREAGVRQQL